jgi:threonine/homoserine/homoserine lactone efflux protein
MPIDQLLIFIAAGLLLNLTPGPDVLYVVTHALRSGARAGIVAALGITAGCFVHIVAAALGVSALMAASATAFMVLKWAGALYLVYVGLRLLLSTQKNATFLGAGYADGTGATAALDIKNGAGDDPGNGYTNSALNVFAKGFATNALNPKVALFFLAFLPQFIAPAVANKPLAFFLLGLLFTFNGMWVNIGWAVTADWLLRRTTARRTGTETRAAAERGGQVFSAGPPQAENAPPWGAATREAAEHGGIFLWLDRIAGTLFIAFGLKLALTDNPIS